MLDFLTSMFKGKKFSPMLTSLKNLGPFLENIEANYEKDHNAKDALIDTAINVLKSHKTPPINSVDVSKPVPPAQG